MSQKIVVYDLMIELCVRLSNFCDDVLHRNLFPPNHTLDGLIDIITYEDGYNLGDNIGDVLKDYLK